MMVMILLVPGSVSDSNRRFLILCWVLSIPYNKSRELEFEVEEEAEDMPPTFRFSEGAIFSSLQKRLLKQPVAKKMFN